MKKFAIIAMCLLAFVMAGCGSLDLSQIGDVKPAVSVQNPRKLGKIAGQGMYLGYVIGKNNPKYSEEIALCEELWARLQANDGTITVADINNLAVQLGSKAVADKEGWVYGAAVAMGMQAAGSFADQAVAGKVDTEAFNEFLAGVSEGVALMQATIPADALVPAEQEKKVKVFDCPDGNCTITAGSRDVKYQQRLAQQIVDDGYADKDEVVKEGHNAYTNCKDLVTRCKMLRKYKVEETLCYIHHFTVENGKLKEIEFRMLNGETEFATTCVACEQYLELLDLPDDIEF